MKQRAMQEIKQIQLEMQEMVKNRDNLLKEIKQIKFKKSIQQKEYQNALEKTQYYSKPQMRDKVKKFEQQFISKLVTAFQNDKQAKKYLKSLFLQQDSCKICLQKNDKKKVMSKFQKQELLEHIQNVLNKSFQKDKDFKVYFRKMKWILFIQNYNNTTLKQFQSREQENKELYEDINQHCEKLLKQKEQKQKICKLIQKFLTQIKFELQSLQENIEAKTKMFKARKQQYEEMLDKFKGDQEQYTDIDIIEEDIEGLNIQRVNMQDQVRVTQENLQAQKQELNEIKLKIHKINQLNSSAFQKQLEELEVKSEAIKKAIESEAEEMERNQRKIVEVKIKRQNLQQELKNQNELLDVQQQKLELFDLLQDVDPGEINQISEQIKQIKVKIIDNKNNHYQKQLQIEQLKSKLSMIQATSKFVTMHTHYKDINQKIGTITSILNELDEKNQGCEQLLKLHSDSQQKVVQTKLQIDKLNGILSVKKDSLKKLSTELISGKYCCIVEKRLQNMVKINSIQKVYKEGMRKLAAMKRSILIFHDKKLSEINQSLKQMWSFISKREFQDIKTIKIQHDQQNIGNSKNFNYRIDAIYASGIALNMRNCSSTGEKLIASVLIRMALAQNLAPKCAIFALDEPFATLDVRYVDLLIDALERFIEFRQDFNGLKMQVLLISHNEKIVQRCSHRLKGSTIWLREDQMNKGTTKVYNEFREYVKDDEDQKEQRKEVMQMT